MNRPLFPLGITVATRAAMEVMDQAGVFHPTLLARHIRGDWGNVCPDDAQSNAEAVQCGARILSSYDLKTGTVWIITEADRSATTILLPSDY